MGPARRVTLLVIATQSLACALPEAHSIDAGSSSSSVVSSAATGGAGGGGGGGGVGGGPACVVAFGEPQLVGSIDIFTDVALRRDGLVAWVSVVDTTQMTSNVHRVERATETSPFGAMREQHAELTDAGGINVVSSISDDEKAAYFTTDRDAPPAPEYNWDVWHATRTSSSGPFTVLGPALATPFYEFSAHPGPDGWLYGVSNFAVANADDLDLWRAVIEAPGLLGLPEQVDGVNTSDKEVSPILDASGLQIFFASNRPRGTGGSDVWTACRRDVRDPFSEAVLVEAAGSSYDDAPRMLSPTGRLYIRRGTTFEARLYVSEPLPR